MVKKSRSKKRGIPKGVQRYKMRAQKINDGPTFLEKALNTVGPETHHVSQAAKLCFRYKSKVCTFFNLIPLQEYGGSKFERAPFLKQVFHHLLVTFYVSLTIYKLCATVHLIFSDGLNIAVVMCAGSFSLSFFSICASSGSSWTPNQMRDLLNSWEGIVENMRSTTGEQIQVFSSMPVCLKLISLTWLSHSTALNVAAFSLVRNDLPVGIFCIVKTMTLIPENTLPSLFWQVAFLPIELLAAYPPMCSATFNGHTFVIGLGILGLYAEQLRKMEITDLDSWLNAERHYKRLRLYNTILMNWAKFMVVPALFSWCVGILFVLYVTCRPSGLPMLVYGCFPLIAGLSMIVISWLCYDAVVAKRAADEIQGKTPVTHSYVFPKTYTG